MVPKIADGPRKSKKKRDFWDDFDNEDWDTENDDLNNEGDWEDYEEELGYTAFLISFYKKYNLKLSGLLFNFLFFIQY